MYTNDKVIMFEGTIYENGYGWVAQKVMRDRDLSPQAKAIYSYICSFAGNPTDINDRQAFPSISLMKAELGIKSQDTFYKHMNALKEKGYLVVEQEKDDLGKFKRNIYKIIAVPTPSEEAKKPQSKKSTTGNPQSNFSTTDNPTTDNWNTNSNRFNSNRFNKDDDDKKKRLKIEFRFIQSFLEEKKIFDKQQIMEVIKYLEVNHSNLEGLHISHLEEAYKKLLANRHTVSKATSYFAKCIVNEITNKKIEDSIYSNSVSRNVVDFEEPPFYNWLEEEYNAK